MKRNIIIAACILVLAFLFGLTGFTLAHPDAGKITERDRLVGVFVTTDYLDLFDFDNYIRDNISSISGEIKTDGDTSGYQGRLYATLVDRSITNEETGEKFSSPDYVFEGINGIPYFIYSYSNEAGSYNGTSGNEAIADGHASISVTDEGEDYKLDGTIYIAPTTDLFTFYINPVYQTADGRIYATSGSGMSFERGGKGIICSQMLDETTTITKNGKASTYSISIKISVGEMSRPQRISLVQFDPDGLILSREEYLPGTLPKSISPEPECSYIILETYTVSPDAAETVTRYLYQSGDETLESFFCREDGICIKQYSALNWAP